MNVWPRGSIIRRLSVPLAFAFMTTPALGLSFGGSPSSAPCTDPLEHDWFDTPVVHTDPLFSRLFPGLDVVTTNDRSRLPEIPEFWARSAAGVCDLGDLPVLLERHGRKLETSDDYGAAAWIIAQTTDEAVMGVQQLGEIMSLRLAPSGAVVDLVARSAATGAIVDWNVELTTDGRGDATWTVRGFEPGLRESFEGWSVDMGDSGPFPAVAGDAGNEMAKLYPTHDGKSIRVTYFLDNYHTPALAEADADRNGHAGVLAYDTMKADWGMPSSDPDQYLDITIDGCNCLYPDDDIDIHVQPDQLEYLRTWGLDYPSDEDATIYVIVHETFHHFQYGIMGLNHGAWVVEGTAHFAVTILRPEGSHQPLSAIYGAGTSGFNGLMRSPTMAPARHSYSYGLAWGHMYDRDGGVPFVKRLLEESAVDPQYPGFIDRALAAMPGDHDSFAEALADLGPRMLTRSFEWPTWDGSATFDWGAYLLPVLQDALVPNGNGVWARPLPPFGLGFLELSTPASRDPSALVVGSSTLGVELYFVSDGAATPIQTVHTDTGRTDKHVFALFNAPITSTGAPGGDTLLQGSPAVAAWSS